MKRSSGYRDAPPATTPGGTAGAGGEGPDKPLPGSTLFTDDQVLEVRLTLAPADWTELEEHGDKEEYVPAAVELSGAGFEDVSIEQIGMRHKGAYSLHHCWDENGGVRLDALIKGDTVREVLDYVEFDAEALLGKLRTDVETAVRAGRVDYEGAGRLLRFYEDGLHGYTYLEE